MDSPLPPYLGRTPFRPEQIVVHRSDCCFRWSPRPVFRTDSPPTPVRTERWSWFRAVGPGKLLSVDADLLRGEAEVMRKVTSIAVLEKPREHRVGGAVWVGAHSEVGYDRVRCERIGQLQSVDHHERLTAAPHREREVIRHGCCGRGSARWPDFREDEPVAVPAGSVSLSSVYRGQAVDWWEKRGRHGVLRYHGHRRGAGWRLAGSAAAGDDRADRSSDKERG